MRILPVLLLSHCVCLNALCRWWWWVACWPGSLACDFCLHWMLANRQVMA
jgi:hypothetical protein